MNFRGKITKFFTNYPRIHQRHQKDPLLCPQGPLLSGVRLLQTNVVGWSGTNLHHRIAGFDDIILQTNVVGWSGTNLHLQTNVVGWNMTSPKLISAVVPDQQCGPMWTISVKQFFSTFARFSKNGKTRRETVRFRILDPSYCNLRTITDLVDIITGLADITDHSDTSGPCGHKRKTIF